MLQLQGFLPKQISSRGIIELMENRNLETLAQELGLKKQQVETVLELTAEGNTIPFIARYRKEKPGNLDETQIKSIIDMDKSLTALQEDKKK